MTNSEDIYTMLIWIGVLLFLVFIIDIIWLKPFRDRFRIDKLLSCLKEPVKKSYSTGNGKGIITVVDDTTVLECSLCIIGLRNLECSLPVIIYHRNLKDDKIKILKRLPGVKLQYFTENIISAILHAPFNQVMYIEPTLLFLKNPEKLFLHNLSLFWLDINVQGILDSKVFDWVKKIIPYKRVGNRILNRTAGTQQTKDLFIIKKSSLLMNNLDILNTHIDLISGYVDEKELFWIACELAKDNYIFVDKNPGIIGNLKMNRICGHVLHYDGEQPLVFSCSLEDDITSFNYLCNNGSWTGIYKCMINGDFIPLSGDILEIINNYALILHDLKRL